MGVSREPGREDLNLMFYLHSHKATKIKIVFPWELSVNTEISTEKTPHNHYSSKSNLHTWMQVGRTVDRSC